MEGRKVKVERSQKLGKDRIQLKIDFQDAKSVLMFLEICGR